MSTVSISTNDLLAHVAQKQSPTGTRTVPGPINDPRQAGTWIGVGGYILAVPPCAINAHRLYQAFANTATGEIITNPDYDTYVECYNYRMARSKADTPPRRQLGAKRTSRSKGSGATTWSAVFGGTVAEDLAALEDVLRNGGPGGESATGPDGLLLFDVQAALVDGLNLEDFTPELISWLDPSLYVNFEAGVDGDGIEGWIGAILGTKASIASTITAGPTMEIKNINFPSAYSYLETGYSIARNGWRTASGQPHTKMLKVVDGVVCIGLDGAWEVVTSRQVADGNVLSADLTAVDWEVVGNVSEMLPTRPNIEIKF